MKNYVVWTNCVIENTEADKTHGVQPANSEHYTRMYEISQASARQYLAGTWATVVFDQPAASRVEMFRANWQRIWDLWHGEPCNILYLDSDTVFVRATEIFERFGEFRLFNWTHPKRKAPFDNYFNAGVRYYPHSMNAATWTIGHDLAQSWNTDIWDQEQLIFNSMFWSQSLDWSDAHRPELNWQFAGNAGPQHKQFNGCDQSEACIIHYHGTRGSDAAVRRAQDLAQSAGVKI